MHLSAPVWNWLESLLGFIGLEAQTLTGPSDHMHPEPVVEIEVHIHVVPPLIVGSLFILSILQNPMEGILGDLKNPPQYFFNQKQRGRFPGHLRPGS